MEIIDIGSEGKAIAKVLRPKVDGTIGEKVVFVINAIPGDIVDIQINKRHKNFMEGYPVNFRKYFQ